MLFDVETNRLTAILDFDFSHMVTPADEYFLSMATLGHIVLGPLEPGPEGPWVRCLFQGCEGNIPVASGDDDDDDDDDNEKTGHIPRQTMKMFSEELARAGVLRPQEIGGHWGIGRGSDGFCKMCSRRILSRRLGGRSGRRRGLSRSGWDVRIKLEGILIDGDFEIEFRF